MEEEPIIIPLQKKSKKPLYVFLITIGILIFIYIVGIVFFTSHYTFNTVIGGRNCSFASKQKVYSTFSDEPMNVNIVYTGRHDPNVSISGGDFKAETEYDLDIISPNHNSFLREIDWPVKCINGVVIDVKAGIIFEDEAFAEAVRNSRICAQELRKEPENAFLKGYDEKTGEFVISEGDPGNVVDIEKLTEVTHRLLSNISADTKEINIDLIDEDCYTKAIVSANNAKLVAAKNKADSMLSSKISYDWNGSRVIVDAETICDWLVVEDNEVYLDETRVGSYVERMAENYDTYGKSMRFHTTSGRNVDIQRGDYGWKTNVEKETAALIEDIKAGAQKNKEPEYLYKGYAKGQDDIGRSYVEVDLSNQHVYLYINGRIDCEADCVSGNVAAGHNTPGGIYGITYKTVNATLRGPGYESFVYYWMPYNGGIGLHDATWRGKFGGEIYKRSGSHGCVNLPLSAAKHIYEKVEKNFPVVTYW